MSDHADAADSSAGVMDPLLRRDLRSRGRLARLADVVQVIEVAAGGVPVGGLGPPAQESLRLRPALSLAFPLGELAQVTEANGRWRIEASCLGLYGQSSPLPTYLTERLFDEGFDRDGRVRDFIDVFNHRLLSLLVRALGKHRPLSASVRTAVLANAGGPDGRDHTQVLAGLLARRPASAAALESALSMWLPGVKVRIEPCAAAWSDLPPEARARLGTPMGGALGERMRACSTAFRAHLGPLDAVALVALLPGGAGHARLRDVVRDFNPTGLTCLVRLTTAPGAMPVACLGAVSGSLGRTTRLDGADPGHVIDYILTPAA